MNFTQEQISELFDEIANKKEGYQQLLKLSLEAIMFAEREQFNLHDKDSSNGYRLSSVFAHKSKLGFNTRSKSLCKIRFWCFIRPTFTS